MIRRTTGWKQANMTAIPDKYPQKRFKEKGCRHCNIMFSPVAPSHLYCSDACKDRGLADNYYRNVYGIRLLQVEEMLKNQNYVCAICEEVGFKMNEHIQAPLSVDHDHNTGKVRGLLCPNCNRALGLLKDNTKSLKRAIQYLDGNLF